MIPRKNSLLQANIQKLFSHLVGGESPEQQKLQKAWIATRMNTKGQNKRCKSVLDGLLAYIEYSVFPQNTAFNRYIDNKIEAYREQLVKIRPLSFGLQNALQSIKFKVSKIPIQSTEKSAKQQVKKIIQAFKRDKIDIALDAIGDNTFQVIGESEVILIYRHDDAVIQGLLKTKQQGKNFKVVIVDSRPKLDGKLSLQLLSRAGIECTYTLFNCLRYHMPYVTKIVIGAIGVTSNGYLQNYAGTAMVCSVAQTFKKPVIILCQTYKFSEKVHIDPTYNNQLEDPEEIVNTKMYPGDTRMKPVLGDWRSNNHLHILNLKFDFTSSEFIDMVITEVGCIPVTSVPVVLREFKTDN